MEEEGRDEKEWECEDCTLRNNGVFLCCQRCGCVRPKDSSHSPSPDPLQSEAPKHAGQEAKRLEMKDMIRRTNVRGLRLEKSRSMPVEELNALAATIRKEKEEEEKKEKEGELDRFASTPDLQTRRGTLGKLRSFAAEKRGLLLVPQTAVEKKLISPRNERKETLIHLAAESATLEELQQLLEKYNLLEVRAKDTNLWTPLHCAANAGRLQNFNLLLDYGGDPMAQNRDGSTPLHYLAKNRQIQKDKEYVKVLAKIQNLGGDANLQNANKESCLQAAVLGGNAEEVLFMLREMRANPNLPNRAGETCLHIAARVGDKEIVKLLLNYKADVNCVSALNQTPKDVAWSCSRKGLYEALGGGPMTTKDLPSLQTYSKKNVKHCQRIIRAWLDRKNSLFSVALKWRQHSDAVRGVKRFRSIRELHTIHKSYTEQMEKMLSYKHSLLQLCKELEHNQKDKEESTEEEGQTHEVIVTPKQVNTLFGNIEVIVRLSQSMLESLDEKLIRSKQVDQQIGSLMLTFVPAMAVYSSYYRNYDTADTLLRRLMRRPPFFRALQDIIAGNSLEDTLILPVQMMPRYLLLLKDILKNTTKEHRDYKDIEEAVEAVHNLNMVINERTKVLNALDKTLDIERRLIGIGNMKLVKQDRQFIMEGDWTKFRKRSALHTLRRREPIVHIFLFNDCIVKTSPRPKLKGSQLDYFDFKELLPFNLLSLRIWTIPSSETMTGKEQYGVCLKKLSGEKERYVLGESKEDGHFWKQTIENLLQSAYTSQGEAKVKKWVNLKLTDGGVAALDALTQK